MKTATLVPRETPADAHRSHRAAPLRKSLKPPHLPAAVSLRVAVLASGRGSNLQALLRAIDDGRVDARVGIVLTDRSGAPCLEHARRHGVPALVELPREKGEARDAYDARLRDALSAESPDLVVLAGFMRILGPAVLSAFPSRVVNIHPALLPSFKGAHGIRDTLAAGAPLAGCTTHLVTGELDGGPMVLQAALAVAPDDTEETLAARVLRLEHQLLPRTVQLIAEDRVRVGGDGRVRIAPGPSWEPAVPDALYSHGF